MKKKGLLGIVAIFMVIALALTGCGQQGEQNAGATGSDSQNGTTVGGNATVDDDKNDGEVTTEPEETPGVGEVDNRKPVQDADGNYVYLITVDGVQTEIRTCVNVWDYITDDTPYDRVDLSQISEDLGWERMPAGFGAARYDRDDGSYALIGGSRSERDYDLPSGERRLYDQTVICFDANDKGIENSVSGVSAHSISNDPYLIGKSETYVSIEQIILYAYMADYYREGSESLFGNNGVVIVP